MGNACQHVPQLDYLQVIDAEAVTGRRAEILVVGVFRAGEDGLVSGLAGAIGRPVNPQFVHADLIELQRPAARGQAKRQSAFPACGNPADFERAGHARFESQEHLRHVFVLDLSPHAAVRIRPSPVNGGQVSVYGREATDQEVGQVNQVRTQIVERAAASRASRTSPAERCLRIAEIVFLEAARKVDRIAQLACLNDRARQSYHRVAGIVEANCRFRTGVSGCQIHRGGLGAVKPQRFLAVHVFAGSDGSKHHLLVQMIRRTDAHHVDFWSKAGGQPVVRSMAKAPGLCVLFGTRPVHVSQDLTDRRGHIRKHGRNGT